ncbi:EGF-like domain-containing protein [Cavenderia fasciculata]|uniref:EGF-like domain-containing protein n=1 Tax=Cavenderia fasciculata TaxID=261658 RepID=F4Q7Y0_CACFS|nr:EGF-like domain-containing protein [Cavenderia fasciculata]EGG15880.1 EGF-like domain-containing protein [Cavenderia fasciculata]|eukprot:XP_004352205.1 EGF-like domain-containing protein [Cavenderia fasciculata]
MKNSPKSTFERLLVLILSLLVCNVIQCTECQVMPSEEGNRYIHSFKLKYLASAVWVIRQYCLNVQEDQASICSSAYFTCSTGTTPHITKFDASNYPITIGAVPSGSQVFEFPELTLFNILIGSVKSQTLNVLNFLKDLPKIQSISIKADTSIKSLPVGFPIGMPLLDTLIIEGTYFQHNFPAFNFVQFVVLSIPVIGTINIDQNTPAHPLLQDLKLRWNIPPIAQTVTFSDAKFPVLRSLTFNVDSSPSGLIIDCGLSIIFKFHLITQDALVSATLANPNYVTSLAVTGYATTFSHPLSAFPRLTELTYSRSVETVFPLTQFPDSLSTVEATNSNFTVFPNIPLKNVNSLKYSNNKFQGGIQWSNFQNANNILLDVRNNAALSTSIPQSFCNNRLYIKGCPLITNVPECFLCYQKNSLYVQTDIVLDAGFKCNITIDTTMIYTVSGRGNITGLNIGYGRDDVVNGRYYLTAITPNKHLSLYDMFIPTGPERNATFSLDKMYPFAYQFNFTILEVGIYLSGGVSYSQVASYATIISFTTTYINNYLPHTVKLNSTIDCINPTVPTLGGVMSCTVYGNLKSNDHLTLTVSNQYYSFNKEFDIPSKYIIQQHIIDEYLYPYDVVLISWDSLINVGSNYLFFGSFGTTTLDTVLVYFNGDPSICTVTVKTSTEVECTQAKYWPGIGLTNITLTVLGFPSAPMMANLTTLESLCTYNGCSGHGTCNINGNCVCDTGYYSDQCSKKYPTFASGEYDKNDRKLISIYGDFGPFEQTIVSITLNSTVCQATYKSQSLINCTLVSEPTDGLALVRLTVDNSTNNGNNWIYFKPSSQSSGSGSDSDGSGGELTCPFNCYGHGQCINGKCKCDTGYSSIDNCLTKTSNHTNTPNTKSPTTSFDIDGIDFQFEMIAIQEIDTDDNIINQVLTNSWSSTILTDNQTQTTTVNYQLNNSDTTTASLVTATISFSQQPRDIQFGNQQLHIDANSIKLSVNISNWTFNTFLTTLRVIFKTTINNDQSIEFDCQDVNIDTLSYDQLSNSIQYLRVVKDNIQFTGRFIDYVLSDGRPTFSRTSIINKTASSDGQSQSTILIGISMPQCQSCSLDPDFTPLLIDKSADSGCDSKSNTWRIVVGVVVGVVGAVAIAAGSIILVKKKRVTKRHNKNMQQKLAKMS